MGLTTQTVSQAIVPPTGIGGTQLPIAELEISEAMGASPKAQSPTSTWHPPGFVRGVQNKIISGIPNGEVTVDPPSSTSSVTAATESEIISLAKHFSLVMVNSADKEEPLLLGQGGMGSVYKATAKDDAFLAQGVKTGDVVAIKFLSENSKDNGKAIERFERENQILIKLRELDHKNIVKVIANGDFNGSPAFVMEYIEGKSLNDFLSETKLTPELADEFLNYIIQAAEAAAAAHSIGIIHRDIKPSNILIDPKNKIAKLTDFGISKDQSRGTQFTSYGVIVGTPRYMALDQEKSHQSDIYSFGVILYEAFLGEHPLIPKQTFGKETENLESIMSKLAQAHTQKPKEIREHNKDRKDIPTLNPQFEQFIYNVAQKDLNKREPKTMSQFVKELKAFKGRIFPQIQAPAVKQKSGILSIFFG